MLEWIEGNILTSVKLTLWAVPEESWEGVTQEVPLGKAGDGKRWHSRWQDGEREDRLNNLGSAPHRSEPEDRVSTGARTSNQKHGMFLADRTTKNTKHYCQNAGLLLMSQENPAKCSFEGVFTFLCYSVVFIWKSYIITKLFFIWN